MGTAFSLFNRSTSGGQNENMGLQTSTAVKGKPRGHSITATLVVVTTSYRSINKHQHMHTVYKDRPANKGEIAQTQYMQEKGPESKCGKKNPAPIKKISNIIFPEFIPLPTSKCPLIIQQCIEVYASPLSCLRLPMTTERNLTPLPSLFIHLHNTPGGYLKV